jgi:O-acetyl-ADP-ribose deacetylase (regulator of RNase III)
MKPELIEGDLLDQDVDVIVNAWNRNIIPWWLLLPQGVSGAIKRRGGVAPFRELARRGPLPLGGAALTGAGRLPFKGIIHVAGINMLWRASRESIMMSVCSSMSLIRHNQFHSVAFPIIGAGSGGFDTDDALQIMMSVFNEMTDNTKTIIVRFRRKRQNRLPVTD